MPEEKKKFKNLSTYAVVMILSVVIIIIVAAMADDREQQFENQIDAQEQTNMNIQNEIVSLKDENYSLSKELEESQAALTQRESELTFANALAEAWAMLASGDPAGARALFQTLSASTPDQETKLLQLQSALDAAVQPEADATDTP